MDTFSDVSLDLDSKMPKSLNDRKFFSRKNHISMSPNFFDALQDSNRFMIQKSSENSPIKNNASNSIAKARISPRAKRSSRYLPTFNKRVKVSLPVTIFCKKKKKF
jgi:hypothetical protein